MTRSLAVAGAHDLFDSGAFRTLLARRVAIPTESQTPDGAPALEAYLTTEMVPALKAMGFSCRVMTHAKARGPFLVAERLEGSQLPTVLGYGHGDVTRGQEGEWAEGLSPWTLTDRADRWYGRGVVDNKGQHAINLEAMRLVLEARGCLGFNARWLIEMGEEMGSPGLREICSENPELFKADVLIASDGPRLSAERPTIFLGARGALASI